MCGRVAVFHHPTYYIEALRRYVEENILSIEIYKELEGKASALENQIGERYNLSPTSRLLAIDKNPEWNIEVMKWGLVPTWAKDDSIGIKCFNARSETMAEKPSFRSAFKRSRCIIPVDGYYEWKKQGSKKIPFYMTSDQPLFLAGLSEPKTKTITIVTKDSQGQLEEIHDRQPVALDGDEITEWLDYHTPSEDLLGLVQSSSKNDWEIHQVSTEVNNSRNEGNNLIVPTSDSNPTP